LSYFYFSSPISDANSESPKDLLVVWKLKSYSKFSSSSSSWENTKTSLSLYDWFDTKLKCLEC
jgi:hypothetical protein